MLDPRFNRDLDDIGASYRHGRTLVAFDGTRLVGTGTVVPRPAGAAEILRMSVAQDARRTGLGGALVRSLVATAREWGCRRVILETASDWTGVVAFYRRCGFTPTHEVDGEFCRDTWFEMHLSAGTGRARGSEALR